MLKMQTATRPDTATVYVVDDDPGMRASLEMVMRVEGVPMSAYDSAESFLASYDPREPGCLILDMHMPGLSGVELIELMRERGWQIPVIVVTGTATVRLAVRSLKMGAVDFLEKPVPHDILLQHVRRAISAEMRRIEDGKTLSAVRARLATLTRRETELLDFIVSGLSNKQIALKLFLSVKTIDNHRANIMQKTGAANAAELVRLKMLASEKFSLSLQLS